LNTSKQSKFFNIEGSKSTLYQGDVIHQFTHNFSKPKNMVNYDLAIEYVKTKELTRFKRDYKDKIDLENPPKSIPLDCEHYRLVWRNIARGTDDRTLISTILPPKSLTAHSLSYIVPIYYDGTSFRQSIPMKNLVFLCGLFNSFILDFVIRHRVDKNVSFYFVKELPIPKYDEDDPYFSEVVQSVGSLICTTSEFDSLKNELNIQTIVKNEIERKNVISKINAYVAKIYDLTEEELKYILKTFKIVEDEMKNNILIEFKKLNN